jgi:putative oxidoreductase
MPFLILIRGLHDRFVHLLGYLACLSPLLGRLAMGVVFAVSGWGKLHNLPKVIEYFRSIGIPAPELQAPFAATNELVCGSLLILGLFTRLAAIPLIVVMCVAITFDPDLHKNITGLGEGQGFSGTLDAFSTLFQVPEFLNIVVLSYLVLYGPGLVSLDRLIGGFVVPGKAKAKDGEDKGKDKKK